MTIAVLSLGGLLPLLIHLIIGGLILWVLWWALNTIAPPEPIRKICTVLIVLVAVVWLINLLLSLDGKAFISG